MIYDLALVGCSGKKLARPALARDLYLGTQFRMERGAAEAIARRWRILSARHGLLAPTDIVAPYDDGLPHTGEALRAWQQRVGVVLDREFDGAQIVLLAAIRYAPLVTRCTLHTPLAGKSIFAQRHFLKEARTCRSPAPDA